MRELSGVIREMRRSTNREIKKKMERRKMKKKMIKINKEKKK